MKISNNTEKLTLQVDLPIVHKAAARKYHARFVQAGQVRQADASLSDISIDPVALSATPPSLFDSRAVFIDHPGFFENPSLTRLAGVTRDAYHDEQSNAIEGDIYLNDTPTGQLAAQIIDDLLSDPEHAPDVGLSLVCYPVWDGERIISFRHIESVDLVFQPAAEGRILAAFSSCGQPAGAKQKNAASPLEAQSVTYQQGEYQPMTQPKAPYHVTPSSDAPPVQSVESAPQSVVSPPVNTVAWEQAAIKAALAYMPSYGQAIQQSNQWEQAVQQTAANTILHASGLPYASIERLARRKFSKPEELQAAIEDERSYLASLTEANIIHTGGIPPRGGQISGMRSSMDKLSMALDALLAGVRPAEGVQPLTGIRELYHHLSGDYEMTGLFHGDRIMFANVNSSTMANMVANALNKMVVNEFVQYPQWWLPIVNEMDYTSLQAIKWITLGGIGELPTVAEGAAYTELSWDDSYESAAFVKKGGYLGITMEAIDKDDTGRLRAAPRALAQAAWLTLSKAVSDVFTYNSGVGHAMTDTYALFESAHHGNLGTSALSITTWVAARTAMRKQTELNSGERLGAFTAPKFLLVPPDLEVTALQVLGSELDYSYALSNGTAAPVNPVAEGNDMQARLASAKSRVIVVDLWTDTNNWAAVCDPRLWPTIGIGYRNGRVPEVFSVASPLAGLMFTNDTMLGH
jgi:hypothetical protein